MWIMANCCDSLHNVLCAFSGVTSTHDEGRKYDELARQFREVANGIFFGGCFQISGIRRLYPIEIEFYYHEENPDGLKDPVMYHTSDRTKNENLSYYPLGSLHFHVSGMDVTFENEEKKYRASFLIREYQVADLVDGIWIPRKETNKNRPTYIYEDMLMGIPVFDGITIQWVTEPKAMEECNLTIKSRVNVSDYQKDENGKYRKDSNMNYVKDEISKEAFEKHSPTDRQKYFIYSKKIFKKCTRPWNFRKKM
jgi:hypothetical protein